MPTDPKSNLSQNSLSESLDKEIDRLLAAGLENFSVRELLGMMLSAAGQAERRSYLAEAVGDKGNGSYPRSVNVGSVPVDIRVPNPAPVTSDLLLSLRPTSEDTPMRCKRFSSACSPPPAR